MPNIELGAEFEPEPVPDTDIAVSLSRLYEKPSDIVGIE